MPINSDHPPLPGQGPKKRGPSCGGFLWVPLIIFSAFPSLAELRFPRERYYSGEEIQGTWESTVTPVHVEVDCLGKSIKIMTLQNPTFSLRAPEKISSPVPLRFRVREKNLFQEITLQIFPRTPTYYWPHPGLPQRKIAIWDPEHRTDSLFQFLGLSPTPVHTEEQIRYSGADLLVVYFQEDWEPGISRAISAWEKDGRPVYYINTDTENWKNIPPWPREIVRPSRWGKNSLGSEDSFPLQLISIWTEEPLAPWVLARFIENAVQKPQRKAVPETSKYQSEVTP